MAPSTVWVVLFSSPVSLVGVVAFPSFFCGVLAPSSPSCEWGHSCSFRWWCFPSSFEWRCFPCLLVLTEWCVPSTKRSFMIHFNSMPKSDKAVCTVPRQRRRRSSATERREEKSTTAPLEGGGKAPAQGRVVVRFHLLPFFTAFPSFFDVVMLSPLHFAPSVRVVLLFPSLLWFGGAFFSSSV